VEFTAEPSPNVHFHDVGALVERSVNRTVSGARPERGVAVKLATGALEAAVTCTETVWPSTVAVMVLVPGPAGVNVVLETLFTVLVVSGETEPLPAVTAKVFVIPSGTKMPPLAVSVPAELCVRFVRINEVRVDLIADGAEVMLSTSHGSEITVPPPPELVSAEGLLFEPHQVFVTSAVAP
jgi:hypothetical protein